MKILGILLIILSISLIAMSVGHEYVEDLVTASTLTVPQTQFEVTPGSKVVISYSEYSTWDGMYWNFNLDELRGTGLDLWSPKVWIGYHETYHGSFTFNAPNDPGTYTYRLKPYMYKDGTQIGHTYKTIYVTVAELQPATYTLTVNTIDSNSNPLSNVEVSINTGVIGTTGSTGIVTKTDLFGTYTVTGTKEDYTSDSDSVSLTADRTVTLQLTPIGVATPTATPTATETATPPPTTEPTTVPTNGVTETPTPDITVPEPVSTPITYTFTVETLDNSDPQEPIPDVKVMINGNTYYTNSIGKVSHAANPGDTLNVVITKEGYNTFEKTYTITSDTLVKVTLPSSGGDFFLDLNLKESNPFYDNEGLFGVMPVWVAITSVLLFVSGIYLIRRGG